MQIFLGAAIRVRLNEEENLKVASPIRRRAGWLAQKMGGAFENHFVARALMQGFQVTEIPDSCRQMRNKIIRVPSPFDLILHGTIQGVKRSAFIDLKRTESKTFSYSKIIPHQLQALLATNKGGEAGYVVEMNGVVVFFDVEALHKLKPRESLKMGDGVLLGVKGHFDVMNIFKG